MRLVLTERFQEDLSVLDEETRRAAFQILLEIPTAFRQPARHAGIGLRKLHSSGVWEVRIGLHWRILLTLERDAAVVRRAATHEEVRRYLKSL